MQPFSKKNNQKNTVICSIQAILYADKGNYNDFGEDTFVYFFSKFINKVINDFTHCRFNYYKKCVKNNNSLLHDKAVCAFPKFDLNFKIYYSKNKKKNTTFII